MNHLINLIDKRFGRLTVISRSDNDKYGNARWNCICDCGSTSTVTGSNLRFNVTKSCGCLHRDAAIEVGKRTGKVNNKKHGMINTSTYNSWRAMKNRCTDPKNIGYKYYGGRGITICAQWINSFEQFLADMGERPEGMTLDRKDPEGNYEPDNCKWATKKEQRANQRKTHETLTA